MKKIFSICGLFLGAIERIQAQSFTLSEMKDFLSNNETMRGVLLIGGVYLAFRFVLDMIRMMLDHSIKIKLLNRSAQEDTIKYFLQPTNKSKDQVYKWIAIFGAVGLGFVIISSIMASGIQSLAIMAFSLAAGYFVYQRYLRQLDEHSGD